MCLEISRYHVDVNGASRSLSDRWNRGNCNNGEETQAQWLKHRYKHFSKTWVLCKVLGTDALDDKMTTGTQVATAR